MQFKAIWHPSRNFSVLFGKKITAHKSIQGGLIQWHQSTTVQIQTLKTEVRDYRKFSRRLGESQWHRWEPEISDHLRDQLNYLLQRHFYKLAQQTESFNPVASIWPAMIKDVIGGEKKCQAANPRSASLPILIPASKRGPLHKSNTTSSRISFIWACH